MIRLRYFLLLSVAWALTVPGSAQESDQAAARAYNAAAALQNSGLHERAIQKWAEFAQQYPKDERLDRAYYYLGICQLRVKKFEDAAKSFQTVLSKWPQFKQADGAQYNLGMAYYETALQSKKPDQFKQAANAFSTVATKYPKSDLADKALYFQGDCLFSAGDVKGAMPAYQKLIQSYPQSPQLARAYYDLGIAQQESGQIEDAAKTYAAFLAKPELQQHELAHEVKLREALCRYDLEQVEVAAQRFQEVAQLKDFAFADFAMLRWGQAKMDAGGTAEAAKILSELPKKFPKSPYVAAARLTAGRCFYTVEDYNAAQAALQPVAASDDPAAAEAAYWLGRSQLKLKDPAKALQTLEAATNRFKEGEFAPYLRFARIDALYEIEDRRPETQALYASFIKDFPNHPLTAQALYMAALTALGAQEYAPASSTAEQFLGNAAFAQHELRPAVLYIAAEASLLADQEDEAGRTKAEQLYRKLVQEFPDHTRAPRSQLRIGWCLHAAKKFDETVAHLNSVVGQLQEPAHLAEAHLLVGRSHAAKDRDQEAAAAYDKALQANPKWERADEVLLAAAQSLRQLDNLDGAKDRLNRLLNEFGQSTFAAQARYQLGEIAQRQDKPEDALNQFKQVVEKYADSEFAAPASYAMSVIYFAKEDYAAAKGVLDKLLAGTAEAEVQQRGLYLRGLTLQRLMDYANAINDLNAYLKADPTGEDAPNARYVVALCQIGLKQFPQASATLSQLLNEKSDFEHADKVYYEMGHALLQQEGKESEAVAAFRTLAEKIPDSPLAAESWFRVGQYHEQLAAAGETPNQAELAKAEAAYRAGIDKAAADTELSEKLQYKLGDMQFQLEKYADAAQTFEKQLQAHPDGQFTGPARYLAAEAYFRLEQYGKALPLFVKVADDKFVNVEQAKVDRYRAQSLYRAGTSAAKLNNWKESETRYTQLLDKFKSFEQNSDARYGLGVALQKQNQLDRALQEFEQVTKETETETAAKARFMIGEICFGQKKHEDAIEHFLLVAVGYPYEEWQALARFESARCFNELGDVKGAIRACRELLDKHPDHAKVQDAQKLLDELTKN